MGYAEELFKLRKRMIDAATSGVVDDSSKNLVETLLIQIMNDGEKNRQSCLTQADSLRKQAATLEGQAGAFSSINSIVYNVLNGFVKSAEMAKEEEKRVEEENKEKEAYMASNSEVRSETTVPEPVDEDHKPAKGKKKK